MAGDSRSIAAGTAARACFLVALLGSGALTTGCDALKSATDQKGSASSTAATSSGTSLSSDATLTSDASALSSDLGLSSDAALTSDATVEGTTGDAAAGQAAVAGVDYFHERLSPYGTWVASASYGEVWVPQVGYGWRPYRTGHWVYTDQGWAWIADDPWGWATFHYGRWYFDPTYGWAWVPGTVWAPAWVAWRDGNGYLGWAPLPPTAGYIDGAGLDLGGAEISTAYWTFVPEAAILAPKIALVALATQRNAAIYGRTANITTYTEAGGRIVDNGIGVARIEQLSGHPVARVPIDQLGLNRPAVFAGGAHAEFGRALATQVAAERARGLVTGRPPAGALGGAHHLPGPLARAVHSVRNAAAALTGHRTAAPSRADHQRSAQPPHPTSPPPKGDHKPPPKSDHKPPPRGDHKPPPKGDHKPPPKGDHKPPPRGDPKPPPH